MTPTPLLFSAMHGAVFFDGKPLTEMRAIAVRQHLVTRALSLSVPESVADALWAVRDQLVAALTASRDQRRVINTVCSPIAAAHRGVDHSHGPSCTGPGREQA